jgi:hypothetical protein
MVTEYRMASDGINWLLPQNRSDVRARVRSPGGVLHAWDDGITLCGKEDLYVIVWPDNVRWTRSEERTCRLCLAVAAAEE